MSSFNLFVLYFCFWSYQYFFASTSKSGRGCGNGLQRLQPPKTHHNNMILKYIACNPFEVTEGYTRLQLSKTDKLSIIYKINL